MSDWQIALIECRLAEAKAAGETVSHEKVAAWLDSKKLDRSCLRPSADVG